MFTKGSPLNSNNCYLVATRNDLQIDRLSYRGCDKNKIRKNMTNLEMLFLKAFNLKSKPNKNIKYEKIYINKLSFSMRFHVFNYASINFN